MKLTLTLLRMLVGTLFIGHGTQKLFGWFGGSGLDATASSFSKMGLTPGRETALMAGVSEAGGGALLAAGLATPLAGAALTGTMVQAIETVHASKGPWLTNGGWEYNATLIAAVLTIVDLGPGPLSLDRAFGLELRGPRTAVAVLACGLCGPRLALGALRRRASSPSPEEPLGASAASPAPSDRDGASRAHSAPS